MLGKYGPNCAFNDAGCDLSANVAEHFEAALRRIINNLGFLKVTEDAWASTQRFPPFDPVF
jgi:hypothetical protein